MFNCELCGNPCAGGQCTLEGVICLDCCKKHSLEDERDRVATKSNGDTEQSNLDSHKTNGKYIAREVTTSLTFSTSKTVDRIHEGDGKKRCKTCKRRLPRNFVANHCSEACARGIHPKDRK